MEVCGSKLLKVDPKGRIFLPKHVLESEGEADGYKKVATHFWLTPGLDGCLWLLDHPEWRRTQRRLRFMDIGDKKLRAVQRFFYERAERVKPDAQGRVLIPRSLLELSQVRDQAVLNGVGRRIEIWAPAVWDSYKAGVESDVIKDLEAILSGEEGPE